MSELNHARMLWNLKWLRNVDGVPIKGARFAVLVVMLSFADWQTWSCYPSYASIAKAAGLSEDTGSPAAFPMSCGHALRPVSCAMHRVLFRVREELAVHSFQKGDHRLYRTGEGSPLLAQHSLDLLVRFLLDPGDEANCLGWRSRG